MAKLNKSESEQAAKNMADTNTDVKAYTVEQITAMDWTERQRIANDFALVASRRVDSRYLDAFKYEYANRVLNIWAGKCKQLDNARRAFRTAADGLSTTDAYKKINDIVKSFNIRGLRPNSSEYRSTVDVERAWGVGGQVYFSYDRTNAEPMVDPDGGKGRINFYELKVSISWSSTGRTLAEATASVKLYQELIEVAAEVEAVMQRERVVSLWGFPEPKDEVDVNAASDNRVEQFDTK